MAHKDYVNLVNACSKYIKLYEENEDEVSKHETFMDIRR